MIRFAGVATLILFGCGSSGSSSPSGESSTADAGDSCATSGEGGVLVDLSGVPADVDAKIVLEGPGGRFEMGTGESKRVAAGRYAILRGPRAADPRDARVSYEPILPQYTVCVAAGPESTTVTVMFERLVAE